MLKYNTKKQNLVSKVNDFAAYKDIENSLTVTFKDKVIGSFCKDEEFILHSKKQVNFTFSDFSRLQIFLVGLIYHSTI